MPCPVVFPAIEIPCFFPPPAWYERAVKHIQPIRVKVHWLWWGWKHHIKDVEYVVDGSGDSGLGCTKNIG